MEKHRKKRMELFNGCDVTEVMEIVHEEVEWIFGDWDRDQGIGSSDINAALRNVLRRVWGNAEFFDNVPDVELKMIRNAVNYVMNEVLA
jgi:hypothetical protein